MSSFSLYAMNFYDRSVENLNRYLKAYTFNVIYALFNLNYIFWTNKWWKKIETCKAQDKLIFKKYPTDYALDLKFKDVKPIGC